MVKKKNENKVSLYDKYGKFGITLLTLFGILFSGYLFIDKRYLWQTVYAADKVEIRNQIEQLDKRLEFKITDDQLMSIRKEMREIRTKYGIDTSKFPSKVREDYMDLEDQEKDLILKKQNMIKQNLKP